MENFKEKLKQMLKQLSFYIVISISFVAGASIGYYYDFIKKSYDKEPQFTLVKKSEVITAIDEYQRLMVIDKKTGNYTVYEDSVGDAWFTIQARNMWGPESAPQTNRIAK